MSELHFIGVPFNSDGTPPDVEHPPQHLRNAGLLDRLAASWQVRDCGDLPMPVSDGTRDASTGILNWSSWQMVTESVVTAVRNARSAGGWPLVVGGDCSILVGILGGVGQSDGHCGLFFVDGHGDFHTPNTSPTGEPADMELAALTGRSPSPLDTPSEVVMGDEDVVVLGIRERDGIDDSSIRVIDYARLCRGDLEGIVREAALALAAMPVWLHFDVDVLDEDLMPVLFPAGPGLTFEQAEVVLRALLKSGRVIGMDVSCFHPNLDLAGTATIGLVGLLTKVLGG